VENVAAAEVSLTPEEMAALDVALAPDRVSGQRYTAKSASMIDR
jgi:hypothetical protein